LYDGMISAALANRAPFVVPESPADFKVLVAAGPASAGRDAERAIDQLARTGQVRVDVLHIVKPGCLTREIWQLAQKTLESSAEVTVEHHLLEDAEPAGAIARLCGRGAYDLVVAPPAARETPWLPWRRSVRAAIVRRSPVPVWTTGARHPGLPSPRPILRVGCDVSLETGGDAHARWAAAFAKRLGASLHLVHVVPPLDDGTIADAFASDRPLLPEAAHARLQAFMAAEGLEASTDVVVGSRNRVIRRLVQARAIDLLCISATDALFGRQMSPGLRALPCPVMCCP
jgi:nucleotide-binding universal stress UspA family protein